MSGGAPAHDAESKTAAPDPETAERIRGLLLGLSADLVAHLSRATGRSPGEDD